MKNPTLLRMGDYNISAKDILAEDTLVRDVFENTTKGLCSLKLRTSVSRVPTWIDTLIGYYGQKEDMNAYQSRSNTCNTIRVKRINGKKSVLTIHLYPSTGSVTIQGDQSELREFEKEFDRIKEWLPAAVPKRPAPSVNELIDAASEEIRLDIQVTPILTTPKPVTEVSPLPGPSGVQDTQANPTDGHVTPVSLLSPNLPPRTTPEPPKKVTPPAVENVERFEKLENELVRMDERFSDQLNQFRAFFEEALANLPTQPVEQSVLPEEVRLRDEATSTELRSRREKNEKLEAEVKRLNEELRGKEVRIQAFEQERLVAAGKLAEKDAQIHSLENEIASLRRNKSDTADVPVSFNKDYTENEVHEASQQDKRRPPLRHLIRCDSQSRHVNPRAVGQSVRISTAGGDTIKKTMDFIQSECVFEPTESITFHVGINTILQNQRMRESDLINMVMGEYEDLVEVTKSRYPSTPRIQLSEVFPLGPSKKWTVSTRARLNAVIGEINRLLTVLAANDERVSIIRHRGIKSDNGVHARDGLHLNEKGIDIFTLGLSSSLTDSHLLHNTYAFNSYSRNAYSHW